MRKILPSTIMAVVVISLTQGAASAQWPAPVGHRQPTADSVPTDDSVLGSGVGTEHRSATGPSAGSKAVNPLDDGMDVPNICSNCDQ